jgi:hypothetical protein
MRYVFAAAKTENAKMEVNALSSDIGKNRFNITIPNSIIAAIRNNIFIFFSPPQFSLL